MHTVLMSFLLTDASKRTHAYDTRLLPVAAQVEQKIRSHRSHRSHSALKIAPGSGSLALFPFAKAEEQVTFLAIKLVLGHISMQTNLCKFNKTSERSQSPFLSVFRWVIVETWWAVKGTCLWPSGMRIWDLYGFIIC